ncbi:MAG: hypothetical protein KJZ58_10490 [Flavobacteriales bacterium]|nr:hypothetical protein [Flavobacteriales bacterium]
MRKAAHVLSVVLHPVWMPTLALVVAFAIDPHLTFAFSPQGQWIIIGMVFIMTALFPVSSMFMLWRSGLVGELAMPRRSERILPCALTLVYFCMAYYLLRKTPNHPATLALFTSIIMSIAAALLINLRWKISLHMVGVGGLVGMSLGLWLLHGAQTGYLPWLFLLAGALGTARLLVTDHTPAQIYAGAALGAVATFTCMAFGIYY